MKLYGKQETLRRIGTYAQSGRMPHGILLTGDEGVGKRVVADYIAMLLMCEKGGNEPCGRCNECMRCSEHIHPDVVYPLRESKNGKYTVGEITEFIAECGKLPNDREFRICVFENIDEMNASCQNALLKFIEEPQHFNRFIFTCQDRSLVLETIISRVVQINVPLADREECLQALEDNGIERAEGEKLFRMFGGSIGRCLNSGKDENEMEMFTLAERIAEEILRDNEYGCLTGFIMAKNRENLGFVLRNLSDIFGNAAMVTMGGRKYGFFSPVSERIAVDMSLERINKIYEISGELLRALDFNPNVQIFSAGCCARLFATEEKAEG